MAAARRSSRRSPARRLRGLAWVGLGLALLWALGLAWFTTLLPRAVGDATRQTDAIVVLTGGSGRLGEGLELLAQERARKLFVSGVYRGVEVEELLRISRQAPQDLACCVTLGYEADDTRGNAAETARWAREQKLRSLRLVTAAYHMPRSLLEFRRVMPEVEILPHPVFPADFKQDGWWRQPKSASLLLSEYSKYLIALVRGWGGGAAP